MFEAKNLIVYSKNHQILIKNISFEIKKGEILLLLGVNGSGKTSLALALTGHLPYEADHLKLNNISLKGMPPHDIAKQGISFVTEEKLLFQDLSVQENLEVVMTVKGIFLKKQIIKERLDFVFSLFPRLYERQNQKSKTLSGGEQQMLALSRALMLDPLLLILDEPSQGLSIQMIDIFFKTLDKLKSNGLSILLIEQNTSHALDIGDSAIVLRNGDVVLKGSASEVKNTNDLMKIFLGA